MRRVQVAPVVETLFAPTIIIISLTLQTYASRSLKRSPGFRLY